MDRRSWLWRRKSSEKSPGGAETESTGSVSSQSERFFDDQVTHCTQSPEATSKAALNIDDDPNESVKTLKHDLCAALLEITTKEDLVKQHSKVAEEAVSGWEKAENEVSALKKKNSALEERLGHLDQALKECVRQLRQAREDQEQKTDEALAKKNLKWESSKSALESQLFQLRSTKNDALELKLEVVEKENLALKSELENVILERDLSIKSAEMASKQLLDSIRKVSKLESECRRLNALARKVSKKTNEHNSLTASSVCADSLANNQSTTGERLAVVDPNQNQKIETASIEIDLMDDFLDMERLVSLPDQSSRGEKPWRSELSEKLEKTEKKNVVLEIQLEESRGRLLEAEAELKDLRNQLFLVDEAKRNTDEKMETVQRMSENKINTLTQKVDLLEKEIQMDRIFSAENLVKCKKLEDELLAMKLEAENQREAKVDSKLTQEKEIALAAEKFAECQKTIATLGQQLKCLANLEDFLVESENEATQVNGTDPNSNSSTLLNLSKRDSEFLEMVNDRLRPLKNRGEGVSALSHETTFEPEKLKKISLRRKN